MPTVGRGQGEREGPHVALPIGPDATWRPNSRIRSGAIHLAANPSHRFRRGLTGVSLYLVGGVLGGLVRFLAFDPKMRKTRPPVEFFDLLANVVTLIENAGLR